MGVSPLFKGHQTQWGTEVLFKTTLPLGLPENVEVMFAAGPEWQRTIGGGEVTNSVAGVAQLDFQFWKLPERKCGWFVEPSYSYSFGKDHEQSLGLTVGLLIALP